MSNFSNRSIEEGKSRDFKLIYSRVITSENYRCINFPHSQICALQFFSLIFVFRNESIGLNLETRIRLIGDPNYPLNLAQQNVRRFLHVVILQFELPFYPSSLSIIHAGGARAKPMAIWTSIIERKIARCRDGEFSFSPERR